MPSLIGTTVAANYGKMTAQQTYGVGEVYSNFGTRQLTFIKVVVSGGSTPDLSTNYNTDPFSNFAKAVRALQNQNEIYFLGVPSSTAFVAAISYDTQVGAETSSNTQATTYGQLESDVYKALGSWGSGAVTVSVLTASGASIA